MHLVPSRPWKILDLALFFPSQAAHVLEVYTAPDRAARQGMRSTVKVAPAGWWRRSFWASVHGPRATSPSFAAGIRHWTAEFERAKLDVVRIRRRFPLHSPYRFASRERGALESLGASSTVGFVLAHAGRGRRPRTFSAPTLSWSLHSAVPIAIVPPSASLPWRSRCSRPQALRLDEIQYFAYLRSAVLDHDLDFTNEYRWFVDRDPQEYEASRPRFSDPRRLRDATRTTVRSVGPAVVAALSRHRRGRVVFGASGTPRATRGRTLRPCIASMILGVFGLLVTNEACRRFEPRIGILATGLVWVATNLPFYMYVTPPMSHAASFFAAALLLLAWLRCEETPRAGFMIASAASSPACGGKTRSARCAAPAPLWPRRQARGSRRLAAAWSVAIFAGFLSRSCRSSSSGGY